MLYKKQLVIEVEGNDREAVLKAFEVVEQKIGQAGNLRHVVNAELEGVEFDDDLSIQSFVKTFE